MYTVYIYNNDDIIINIKIMIITMIMIMTIIIIIIIIIHNYNIIYIVSLKCVCICRERERERLYAGVASKAFLYVFSLHACLHLCSLSMISLCSALSGNLEFHTGTSSKRLFAS